MYILINLFILVLLTTCPPNAQEQGQKKVQEKTPSTPPVLYGAPKPHSDDPDNPWMIEKLVLVETNVIAGQKRQIATFQIPKSAKEAIIEGKISNSLRNVELFIIPEKEAKKLRRNPSYSPKHVEALGRALGFHFPVTPGVKYTVWLWNQDAESSNHVKLQLTRHYR